MGCVGALRCTVWGLGNTPTFLSTTLNYPTSFLVSCLATYLIFAMGGMNFYRSRLIACGFLGVGLLLRLYTESAAPAWFHLVRAIEFGAWLDVPLVLFFYAWTLVLPVAMLWLRLKLPSKVDFNS